MPPICLMAVSPSLGSRHPQPVTSCRTAAFTLIELLVVIAIIAILMGLAFPAYQGVLKRTYITSSRNTVTSLEEGIRAYMLEYGRLPVKDTAPNDGQDNYYTDIKDIIRVLMGENINGLNPKKRVFLEPKIAKVRGGKPSDGLDTSTYTLYDPWGNSYILKLDTSYNNKIEYYSSAGWNSPNFFKPVVVISAGPNGTPDDPDEPGYDDIVNQ